MEQASFDDFQEMFVIRDHCFHLGNKQKVNLRKCLLCLRHVKKNQCYFGTNIYQSNKVASDRNTIGKRFEFIREY